MGMKKDKLEDLRAKTPDELRALILDLKKQMLELRFEAVSGQVKDTDKSRRLRRQVAAIKTVMAEKAAKEAK